MSIQKRKKGTEEGRRHSSCRLKLISAFLEVKWQQRKTTANTVDVVSTTVLTRLLVSFLEHLRSESLRTMARTILSCLLLLSSSIVAEGFVIPQSHHHQSPTTLLNAKKTKGFGTAKEAPKPKRKSPPVAEAVKEPQLQTRPESVNPFPQQADSDMSQGKAALEKLRRGRAEQRNEELRKIKELKDVDAMLQDSSEAAVIPEKVAQRMGNRMIPFVGIPLFGSMAAFIGFWYMATYRDMEFQPALVASSTIAFLLIGLVGITYSIMSTSWDPDREGSMLGKDEFSKNLGNIKEGLSRSKENAVLRDRMYEYSPEEIANVDAKDAPKEKRQQSFSDKFGDDLE